MKIMTKNAKPCQNFGYKFPPGGENGVKSLDFSAKSFEVGVPSFNVGAKSTKFAALSTKLKARSIGF